MIITTTDEVQDRKVKEYLGIVTGESIIAAGWRRDFLAGLRSIVGGPSGAHFERLVETRETAIRSMVANAEALGADAIVGVNLDYETMSDNMMMIAASGTAVRLA